MLRRNFLKSLLRQHLFVATPSVNAKKILVKATDRFGNIYEQEIALHQ